MTFDVVPDVRSALEWYNATAIKTMLRWRTDVTQAKEGRSKADALARLRECLLDPASIRRAIASGDPILREALALLKRKGGVMAASAMRGQIGTWHPELGAEVVHAAPSELVRRALAFWHAPQPRYGSGVNHDLLRPAADNPHSVLIYSAPEILAQVEVPPDLGEPHLTPIGEAALTETPGQSQRRILAFLRAVETRSPRVLQSGLIGAREREALGNVLGLPGTESAAGGEIPASALHLHPVNFLRTTLGAAGLLEVSGDRVLRTTPATLRFVALSPVRQAQLLLEAWLASGANDLFGLPHLQCERRANVPKSTPDEAQVQQSHRRLIEALRQQVRPGYWYDPADFSRALRYQDVEFLVSWRDPTPYRWNSFYEDRHRPSMPSYSGITLEDSRGRPRTLTMGVDWELVEGAFIRAVLRGPLSWLGLIDYQVLAGGGERFALTSLGAEALRVVDGPVQIDLTEVSDTTNALIVQPNFDVLVYEPEAYTELLYQVERFAQPVSADRVAVYRITRESLCAGLQLGLQADDVLGLLERAARVPIPQNVAYSVRDWARQFEAVHWVRNAWLVEARDPGSLDRALAAEGLVGLARRLSPTVALFSGSRPEGLAAACEAQGIEVIAVDAGRPLQPCVQITGETTLHLDVRDDHFYLRHTVEQFAEGKPAPENARVYQLTPATVAGAVAAGWSAEGLLEVLDQVIRGPLPPGLRLRVKGWSGAFPPLTLGAVALLTAPDPESFRELRADTRLAGGFISSVSATAAIVRLEAVPALQRALAERGIGVVVNGPLDDR